MFDNSLNILSCQKTEFQEMCTWIIFEYIYETSILGLLILRQVFKTVWLGADIQALIGDMNYV